MFNWARSYFLLWYYMSRRPGSCSSRSICSSPSGWIHRAVSFIAYFKECNFVNRSQYHWFMKMDRFLSFASTLAAAQEVVGEMRVRNEVALLYRLEFSNKERHPSTSNTDSHHARNSTNSRFKWKVEKWRTIDWKSNSKVLNSQTDMRQDNVDWVIIHKG